MNQRQVYPASPYTPCNLGSFGKADCMLIKQFQFPDTYDADLDQSLKADHDRCYSVNFEHASNCFKKHVSSGEIGFESWALRASNENIFNFLKDILQADPKFIWTGYRIMGSVSGTGHAVYSLALFAKHPDSDTLVYTGENAPNMRK